MTAANSEQDSLTISIAEVLLAELRGLRAELAALSHQLCPLESPVHAPGGVSSSTLPEQLVTLDQIAAMVHRAKRTMERYCGKMPAARVRGRRGQPHLWAWAEVRTWLEATFNVSLPEQFPRGHY